MKNKAKFAKLRKIEAVVELRENRGKITNLHKNKIKTAKLLKVK